MDDITLMDKAPYAELVATPWGRWFISDMADFMGERFMKLGTSQVYGGKTAVPDIYLYSHSDDVNLEGNFGKNYHPVEAHLLKYSDKQVKEIEAFFKKDSKALADLQELRLPLETIVALEKLGIPMRMTQEDDFMTDYYCSDGGEGEPCSHVAGMLVRMGHLVDNDPCLIFLWHGYNIRKFLKIKKAPREVIPALPEGRKVRHRDINPKDYATTWWGQKFAEPFACNENRDELKRAKSDISAGRMGKLSIGTRSGKVTGTDGKAPPAAVPSGISASLRPYQERGFSWLVHNLRARMGSIIADDMGLGKTLQVISSLQAMKDQGQGGQALVVVPASIVLNWEREVKRFAPGLTTNVFYGSSRRLDETSDLTITTYGTVRSEAMALAKREWSVIVADEAQNIKNPQSQIFQAMCSLKRGAAIAMTGTPVENRLADYWAIMEFVNPGLFGSFSDFNAEYAVPIERERDADAVQRLRQVTAPFIIRRLKSDKSVIADLPDKISTDRYCGLTKTQAAMYQAFVNDGLEGIKDTDPAIVRSANVLKLILRLKQTCDAPELFEKAQSQGPAQSGKAMALLELLSDITQAGRKAIVFTQFKEMGDLVVKWIGERLGAEPDFINGSVPVKRRQEMVDRFQTDPKDRIMVLSLKAAGIGLNLTAASAVIHYDLWWNPAVEDQATDRAYRIGQHSNVEVFRFICANTFEEKINEIINSKKELADLTVLKGEKWLGDMSKSELRQFLSLAGGSGGADAAEIEEENEGEI